MKRFLEPISHVRHNRPPLLCLADFATEIGVSIRVVSGHWSRHPNPPKVMLTTRRRTNLVNFYRAEDIRDWWAKLNKDKP